MNSTLAFIGGGNMAAAIIGGLRASGRAGDLILVIDPGEAQRDKLRAEHGVRTLAAADASLAESATVVWAVKPQLFQAAAAPCAAHVRGALQLSVMAGIRSDAIVRATGSERVVRSMPNTPALIGQGIAGLYARDAVSAEERRTAEALLAPTGRTLWVAHEEDLDAVTALSGSGPAYVFYFVEAMMQAAQAATKFGTAADTATGQLGTLGNGFGSFGQFLAQALGGGAGGGGFLQSLISLGAQAIGIPGFAGGGRHRGGLRVVGENGPELEYTGPSTILPADLTRALLTSRAPVLTPPEPANSAPSMQVIVHNYSGQPVQTEERTDAQGRRTAIMTIGEQGAAALRQPGNPMRQAMERQYGAKPRGIVR